MIKQFDHERSELRKPLVAMALPIALFVAVVVQLTVVNRLPLPGGDAPDLVLLLVTAVAVTSNTMIATLTGFAGGLALDIAPPVTHYAGEYALVFCLVGYLAARAMGAISAASGGAEHDPSVALAVMAVAAAAGEAGKAGLGMLLSDPNVTGPTIRQVLPGAILYDLLLTPVVYLLVSLVAGLARPVPERAPVFIGAQRLASVFRLASAGAVPVPLAPRKRLAGARSNSLARTDRGGTNSALLPLAGGRATKLNFAHSGRTHRAEGSALARPGRTPKINFAGDRPAITPRRQKGPGKGWLKADRRKPPPVRRAKPSKGWLRPSRPPRPNWYSNGPTTGWIRRSRAKDRWRTRRRSLSGALLSTVRDLLPTGERR